jgi:hypothetical protein
MRESHTLIFVDRALATAIAAKVVGVLKSHSEGRNKKVGANWLISAGLEATETTSEQYDLREMLPEDLMYYIYPTIPEKHDKISSLLPKMTTGTNNSLAPGDVVSVNGRLLFRGFSPVEGHSPFQDTDVDLPLISFHGEKCIVAELFDDSYKIPVYLPDSAKYQVVYCNNQPVEITGITRWVPPYSPGGAGSLNLAIRAAAVWLR